MRGYFSYYLKLYIKAKSCSLKLQKEKEREFLISCEDLSTQNKRTKLTNFIRNLDLRLVKFIYMYIAIIFRHKECGNEELDNLAHTYQFGATFTLSFELQKSKIFCAAFLYLEYEGKLGFF